MARFAEDSPRLVELVGTGLSMAEACQRAGISYATVRKWIDKGRRDPASAHGQFVSRVDGARSPVGSDRPGPVESRFDALLRGRELHGEAALAAEQARTLARKVDQLGATPGAAAGQALAHCSRRLEEIVPVLALPKEDDLDKLKAKFRARRSQMRGEMASVESNGKGSGARGPRDLRSPTRV